MVRLNPLIEFFLVFKFSFGKWHVVTCVKSTNYTNRFR